MVVDVMRLIADRFFRVNTVWYRTHWHLYRRRGASHQWSAPAWNWTSWVNIRTVETAVSDQLSAVSYLLSIRTTLSGVSFWGVSPVAKRRRISRSFATLRMT